MVPVEVLVKITKVLVLKLVVLVPLDKVQTVVVPLKYLAAAEAAVKVLSVVLHKPLT